MQLAANPFLKARITKQANPYIGQAYKGDSGSKSGLKYWTDGMESAAVRVGCWICSAELKEAVLVFKCVCLIGERSSCTF